MDDKDVVGLIEAQTEAPKKLLHVLQHLYLTDSIG